MNWIIEYCLEENSQIIYRGLYEQHFYGRGNWGLLNNR